MVINGRVTIGAIGRAAPTAGHPDLARSQARATSGAARASRFSRLLSVADGPWCRPPLAHQLSRFILLYGFTGIQPAHAERNRHLQGSPRALPWCRSDQARTPERERNSERLWLLETRSQCQWGAGRRAPFCAIFLNRPRYRDSLSTVYPPHEKRLFFRDEAPCKRGGMRGWFCFSLYMGTPLIYRAVDLIYLRRSHTSVREDAA